MKTKIKQGFTLIELMIVVAIIAVLAAIAIPAYQHYQNKSKFGAVVQAMGGLKSPGVESIGGVTGFIIVTPYQGATVSLVGGNAAGPITLVGTITDANNTALNAKVVTLIGTEGAGVSASSSIYSWACTSTVATVDKPSTCN